MAKRGRSAKIPGERSINAGISLNPSEIEELTKAAEWGKCNRSQVVRELLKFLPNWYYEKELKG